ncbi:TetR/AcrR family transcriptional regulator [uncultured Cytophaga sp.]|uniref:TetR/AcrR family transcriptional regulator n=1 Tax=uncultured Cytophaga sp. TaxID=160238 RepID=UPI00262674E7|nr:TetR/AcrR family transcriptional regulator [uncultured Cytophaga sp.]
MVENDTNAENCKLTLIIDAAQKRFAYYGLSKTTMTEIASDIGLSKASLYYYFADKDTLFRAVVKREQDFFLNEMRQLIQEEKTAEDKFFNYTKHRHTYLRKVFVNLTQLKMTMDHVKPLLGNLMEVFMKAETELIESIFQEGIKKKEFNNMNTKTMADAYISSAQGLRTLTIKNRNSYVLEKSDFEEIETRINIIAEIFIKAIKKNKDESIA